MGLKQGYRNVAAEVPTVKADIYNAINRILGKTNKDVQNSLIDSYIEEWGYLLQNYNVPKEWKNVLNPRETSKDIVVDSAEIDSAAGNVTFDYGNDNILGYVYFSPVAQQPQQQ